MIARGVLVLAMIAALLGAPTAVSAAGNELSAAQASPGSGSTSTVFTLKVTYDGKFAVTSVTASVAGRTLIMARIGGSTAKGTWSASSTLPAGTWQVTFSAVPERGNSPSLAGPSVQVGAAATPPPTATPKPPARATTAPPPAPTPKPPPASTGTTATTPQPAGASSPPADGGIVQPGTKDDGDATPTDSDANGGGGTDSDGSPRHGNDPEPGADGAPAATDRTRPSRQEAPANGWTTAAAEDATSPADGLLSVVLLVGMSGVAAVALIGVAMMLAGRRRRHEDETPIPTVSVGARVTRSSSVAPETVMERRMLRQARVRMTDDPIVAALGIGNDDDDRRRARRKAGQVGRGPGERPNVSRN